MRASTAGQSRRDRLQRLLRERYDLEARLAEVRAEIDSALIAAASQPQSGSGSDGRRAYRPAEAARAVGLSTPTINRAIARGELRAFRTTEGGAVLIRVEDLDAYILALSEVKGPSWREVEEEPAVASPEADLPRYGRVALGLSDTHAKRGRKPKAAPA